MSNLMFYVVMRMLIANEGFEAEPYKIDDVWHIGYGFNLEARMPNPGAGCADYQCLLWSKADAFNQLSRDVIRINSRLRVRYKCYKSLPVKGQVVMIDMAYNLGVNGLFEFKDFLVSMCVRNYEDAGHNIMDSKYYKEDVPARALRNIKILTEGIDL